MLSSVASRRSLAQRCLTIASTMGNTRCTVATPTTFLSNNHSSPSSDSFPKVSPAMMNRALSSNGAYGGTPNGPLRSQPQYAIFGEKTMMSIKMIPPVFRCLKNGSLVLDQNKKGRILLEWSPRGDAGTFRNYLNDNDIHPLLIVAIPFLFSLYNKIGGFDREAQIRFGLSPEEVGFLLHQLPDNEVEFVRRLPADQPGTSAADMPEKILRITPGEGGQFAFKIDYEKDSVGGQIVGGTTDALGPLEVVAQLGEYVVMRKLMEQSLPSLIGWDVQTNFALQNAMNLALQAGVSGQSNPRSRPVAQQQQQQAAVPQDDIAADV